jgi:hypothetical protein
VQRLKEILRQAVAALQYPVNGDLMTCLREFNAISSDAVSAQYAATPWATLAVGTKRTLGEINAHFSGISCNRQHKKSAP